MPKQRWIERTDESSHHYLIPAEKDDEFDLWLEHTEGEWGPGRNYEEDFPEWTGTEFEIYRIEGSRLTFEEPLVDGQPWGPRA
jgi:hypothetical protein